MEKVPPYLAPVLIGDRDTSPYQAIVERARRLRRYGEDVALRLLQVDLQAGRSNPRDTNATGWLILHPEHIDAGEVAA
jgi:hypothetical protein